jgi:hypothetical protein
MSIRLSMTTCRHAICDGNSVRQESDKAARRWFRGRAAPPEASLDESLRQVGADLLGEPIPERLLQALYGTQGEAESSRPAMRVR